MTTHQYAEIARDAMSPRIRAYARAKLFPGRSPIDQIFGVAGYWIGWQLAQPSPLYRRLTNA